MTRVIDDLSAPWRNTQTFPPKISDHDGDDEGKNRIHFFFLILFLQ